jgi:Xaa-Pro aminopeptidase
MTVDGGRLHRLRQERWPADADALVVADGYNRRYLTGCPDGAALVVTPSQAVMVVPFTEAEAAAACAAASPGAFWSVRPVEPAAAGGVAETLAGVLRAFGARRVAYEGHAVTVATLAAWQRQAEGVAFFDAGQVVEPLRAVKDGGELAAMRRAAALMDAAFADLLPQVRAGVSERELALALEYDLRRRGAEGVAFPFIVASGPNGAYPHARAGERILQPGDLVTFDVGARVAGYCSDMTRTVAVGEPGRRAREVYAAVSAALDAALAAVRAGAACRDVDAAARSVLAGAGLDEAFGHGLGHGVGLAVHEAPRLSRHTPEGERLLPGMVITIEPGVYLPGWGGVRIEEEVVVGEGGYELLTRSPRQLLVL